MAEAKAALGLADPGGDEAGDDEAGDDEAGDDEGPEVDVDRARALLDRAIAAAPSSAEAVLLRLEVAIFDDDDPDLALRLIGKHRSTLAGLQGEELAWALWVEAEAFAARGEPEKALAIHERSLQAFPDDAWHLSGRGQRLFALARFDEAAPDLERAERLLPEDATTLWTLACLRERQRRLPDADRLFARAADLDPDAFPAPVRIPRKAFDRAVQEALGSLPDEVRHALEGVALAIEDLPPPDVVREHEPEVMGLFSGPSVAQAAELTDRAVEQQPTVTLYRRNIEKNARDEAGVVEQVRITVLHELGHRLGFDEDGVERLGLG